MSLKPVIYLDQDGVMADFEGWAFQVIGPDWKEEIDKDNWGRFADYPDIYKILPLMEGALPLYRGCVEIMGNKNQVQILTAIPNRALRVFPHAPQHKIEWAEGNIDPDLRVHFGPFAQHKQFHFKHPGDILIDDMAQNIEQWRSVGGFGIVHTSAVQTLRELRAHFGL